jgi:hypothetical protein
MSASLSPEVRALFDGPNYAHVDTLMPDGGPHSVPLWIGVENERGVFLVDGEHAWMQAFG